MIIAIILAREGSKRLKGKNMVKLGGKPLIQWAIESAINSRVFDKIIVSSDWKLLLKKMKKLFKEQVEFRERLKVLSMDDTPGDAVIQYELKEFEEETPNENQYCILEPTSPFRSHDLIQNTLEKFTPDYNSLFTVNKYTLQPDGLIYWFRDPFDVWKTPSNIIFNEPVIDIDYVYNLRVAEYLMRCGREYDV